MADADLLDAKTWLEEMREQIVVGVADAKEQVFSCKGRGVCPSCNTRRMVETAAHLTDHVLPSLPVGQWMLSVPKRLRSFIQRDAAVLNMVLRIFLRVIEQRLHQYFPGTAQECFANLQS